MFKFTCQRRTNTTWGPRLIRASQEKVLDSKLMGVFFQNWDFNREAIWGGELWVSVLNSPLPTASFLVHVLYDQILTE